MRVLLAVILAMIVSAGAYAQPAHPAFTSGTLTPGNCAQFGTGSQAGTMVDSGAAGCGGGKVVFAGVGDWVPVLNSATGTGTDNNAALTAAFNACNQNGTNDIYIPAGKYFNSAPVQFGACDTSVTMAAGAQIVCGPATTCFQWLPATPTGMPVSGIVEGYSSSMANGFAPSTGGSGCEVGDILTLRADVNSYARTIRHRALFTVATCTGAAVATMNVLYDGDYLENPGNGSSQIMQTVSGTTAGVIVNNLTWNQAPTMAVAGGLNQVTQLVFPGTNSVTEGNSCDVMDAGPTLCIGDVVKIISNQQAPWLYSGAEQSVNLVNDTGDFTYGPIVAAGGSGYTAGDVLTLQTLTSPIAKGALGFGVQTFATTPATVTVASVTATGAITGITITTTGTYDHINYRAIPLTGGTGTGAQAYFTYHVTVAPSNNLGVTYADMATVAKVLDANNILLNRITTFPHAFDAVHPPIVYKLPKQKLITNNLTCAASGQYHNAAYSNRVPSCLDIFGAYYPKVDVRCAGQFSICVEEMSVWMGDFNITCEDAEDMPPQAGTGYCGNSLGASYGSKWKIIANDVRHGMAGGSYAGRLYSDLPAFWNRLGGSDSILIHDSVVQDAHVAAFNTHEDAYNWTFANDWSMNGAADPHSTSGVLSQGTDVRSYNTTIQGGGSINNQWCLSDAGQRPDWSGVFATSGTLHVQGFHCSGAALIVGGNTAYGFNTTGDANVGNIPSNTHNNDAVSVVENSTFDDVTSVLFSQAGQSRWVFNNNSFSNFGNFCNCNGPVDIAASGNVFDNTGTKHVPSSFLPGNGAMFFRGAATMLTGTSEWIITNNVFKQSRTAVAGSIFPSQFFRNLSANALDGVTLLVGGNQLVGGGFSLADSTSGGPISYQSTDFDPVVGKAYKRITTLAVPMAATGDAAIIPVPASIRKYSIVEAEVSNCTATVAAGLAGLWSGAGKTGINWAANQALTTATSTTTKQVLTLTATAALSDTLVTASPNIYFNVGTGVASPTCNVTVVLLDTTNF